MRSFLDGAVLADMEPLHPLATCSLHGVAGDIEDGLPRVLHRAAESSRPSLGAVRQAVDTRERIRWRLAGAGQAAGSSSGDLEEVHEGHLAEV